MGTADLVDLSVLWAPSIFFVLIIAGSTLIGMVRGYRKSLILFIQSIIAFSLCLIIYLCLVNIEAVDKFLLVLANSICKLFANKDLPSLLEISSSGTHLKEVITDYIIIRMDFGDMINIMLSDNTSYIYALINFIYHIAFAIFMWFIYEMMLFIFYIIYLIFFSNRRYIKKIDEKFSNNLADGSYRKKPGRGALVGCVRGTITALISLSFLGSALYMIAGKGEGSVEDINFGDETTNQVFSMYRSFDKYGTNGIYKVLNAIDNDDDVPLYLFAADLVLQGSYVEIDEETGEENKIQLSLRNEIGVYSEFAREAGNLFLKYGGERIRSLILGKSEEDPFYIIMDVFSEPEFQADFQIAIDKISDAKYINKLAFSLIDSYLANINDFVDGVPQEVGEMARIIFKKGYYSSMIPEEKALASSGKVLPYISSKDIILRQDLSNILRAFYVLVDGSILEGEEFDPAVLIRQLLPYIRSLSLFDIRENNPINPVLGRVFMLCENTYLKEIKLDNGTTTENKKYLSKEETDAYQTLISNYKIDYVKEINALLDSVDAITEMYNNVYDPEKEVIDVILSIFDEDGVNYSRNIELFNQLLDTLTSSQLLGKVLGSSGIVGIIEESFKDISPDFKLPSRVHFANTYNDDGELVEYGELYNILCGLKELGKKENKEFIDSLLSGSDTFSLESLQTLAGSINKINERGETLCDYISSSVILNSVISNLIYENNGSEGTIIYIPEIALEEENGEKINLIKKPYFKDVLTHLEDIFEVVGPLLENPENMDYVYTIFENPIVLSLLKNPIIQATFANQIVLMEDNIEFFIFSSELHNIENWVDKEDGSLGEMNLLLNAIKLLGINLSNIDSIVNDATVLFSSINSLTKENLQEIFSSEVLHYSISEFIIQSNFEGLSILVPAESVTVLKDEIIDCVIKKVELIEFFHNCISLNMVNLVENPDYATFLNDIILNKEELLKSNITAATLIYNIYNFLPDEMITPELEEAGKELKSNINDVSYKFKENLWASEFENLLDALDEIFEISKGNNIDINDPDLNIIMEEKVKEIFFNSYSDKSEVVPGKNRLQAIYDSVVVKNLITHVIDNIILENYTYENGQVSDIITNAKDAYGYYLYKEIYSICDITNQFDVDIENLENIDFYARVIEVNEDIINDIEDSYLVRALISSSIYIQCDRPDSLLFTHPNAWDNSIDKFVEIENRFALFKDEEIISLLKLIDGEQLSSLAITTSKLRIAVDLIGDDYGQCKSYLLVASISPFIINSGLVIPSTVIDDVAKTYNGRIVISSLELYNFIKALLNMKVISENENFNIENLSLNDIIVTEDNSKYIYNSSILNATITSSIKIEGFPKLYVGENGYSFAEDQNGNKIIVLTETEFKALVDSVYVMSPTGCLNFDFNVYALIKIYQEQRLDIIVKSTVIRFLITEMLQDLAKYNNSVSLVLSRYTPDDIPCAEIYSKTRLNGEKQIYVGEDIIEIVRLINTGI
ncbi:MAG: hypothetical protein ACI318_01605 [Bacilli bacterium]